MNAKTKYNVLVVDDHANFRYTMSKRLSRNFKVTAVGNSTEAIAVITGHQFDVALVDMHLGENITGVVLAKRFREINKNMAIILMSAYRELFYASDIPEVDDCVLKYEGAQIVTAIYNAIYKTRMPSSIRMRRARILKDLLLDKEAVRFISRETGKPKGIEAINGLCIADDQRIRWVVYNLPEHEKNTFTIGVASTSGCGLGCDFCLSGSRRYNRQLTADEIDAQVLHGFDSYHARGVFEAKRSKTPWVNFACEGDALVSNLENTAEAIARLAEIEKLGINFIITTIGDERALEKYLKYYIKLPRVRFYWSLNSVNEKFRQQIMPATKGRSITAQRDLFREIAKQTGKRATASFIKLKGVNNTSKELDEIAAFLGNDGLFDVKVMPHMDKISRRKLVGTRELTRFKHGLGSRGIDCRIRNIIGADFLAGCGLTVPEDDYLFPPDNTT